jgi:AAA15 family ATPase/GTPase
MNHQTNNIVDFLPIEKIFLDPNNYRFIDNRSYQKVDDSAITNQRIQERTFNFIVGKNNEGIRDLIKSFRNNGYLNGDQIHVQKISDDEYKVIEGNRRIATLKFLQNRYEKGISIGQLDPSIFQNIPVMLYDDKDSQHYRVIMGLQHITGKKKWSPVNQAQLIKDLIDGGMSEEAVVDALGTTKHFLRRTLRALSLINAYKDSDYGDQFTAEMYNIFHDAVNSQPIKSWLAWDDFTKKPTNADNAERFFSWLSKPEIIENDGERKILDPIIQKGSDVRDIARFIHDDKALEWMEDTRQISDAYLSGGSIGKEKFNNTLFQIDKYFDSAIPFATYADGSSKEKLEEIQKKLRMLLASQNISSSEVVVGQNGQAEVLLDLKSSKQFSEILIKKYKQFNHLKIESLNRVNIFAGINNIGKSSLLEAILLLSRQNDINGFLNIQRRRGKFLNNAIPSNWLNKIFIEPIEIEGYFWNSPVSIKIEKRTEDEEHLDKTAYLNSVFIKGQFADDHFESYMRLYGNKPSELFYKNIKILCPSVYSTPFAMQLGNDLYDAHEASITSKSYDKILEFIQSSIDGGILDINLVNPDDLRRFEVNHDYFEETIDLTQFGEGLQRIFYIALLFAKARNGIVLIDEIETAIHYSLLVQFTKFIQKLAEDYNVQVFVSSHSKECINAFLENGYENETISGYHLEKKNGEIVCQQVTGERFSRLIQNFNYDLRG